jgi:hypothetical protein
LVIATFLILVMLPVDAESPEASSEALVVSNITPPSDHLGGYQEYECEQEPQLALLATDFPGCGNFGGSHVLGGWGYMIFGFRSANAGNAGPIPLTGKLEARLTWSGGQGVLGCYWTHGQFQGCGAIIEWPPIGATFEFECYSVDAYGHWAECFLGHG